MDRAGQGIRYMAHFKRKAFPGVTKVTTPGRSKSNQIEHATLTLRCGAKSHTWHEMMTRAGHTHYMALATVGKCHLGLFMWDNSQDDSRNE
jgi:hypothetical protein